MLSVVKTFRFNSRGRRFLINVLRPSLKPGSYIYVWLWWLIQTRIQRARDIKRFEIGTSQLDSTVSVTPVRTSFFASFFFFPFLQHLLILMLSCCFLCVPVPQYLNSCTIYFMLFGRNLYGQILIVKIFTNFQATKLFYYPDCPPSKTYLKRNWHGNSKITGLGFSSYILKVMCKLT